MLNLYAKIFHINSLYYLTY